MHDTYFQHWLNLHPLNVQQIDCIRTIMLKVLDGKCKMPDDEKRVITQLYDALLPHYPHCEDPQLEPLIREARSSDDDRLKHQIYEQRLLAETRLSRPVMKAFKRWIRQTGIYEHGDNQEVPRGD